MMPSSESTVSVKCLLFSTCGFQTKHTVGHIFKMENVSAVEIYWRLIHVHIRDISH